MIWMTRGKPASDHNLFKSIGGIMVSQELLEILRCPNCVREKEGLLDYYKESWLTCTAAG
jgi:hypothetical protein